MAGFSIARSGRKYAALIEIVRVPYAANPRPRIIFFSPSKVADARCGSRYRTYIMDIHASSLREAALRADRFTLVDFCERTDE